MTEIYSFQTSLISCNYKYVIGHPYCVILMFIIHLDAKFHIPSSNDPLVTAIKLKAKKYSHYYIHIAFYILQKKLPQQKIHHHTSF